jgi:DNA-binding CsgD family transcriptional regulator
MSRNLNSAEPVQAPATISDLVAAIVGAGAQRGRVAEILRGQGWETESYAGVGELAGLDWGSLLVVIVEPVLIDAAGQMKVLGPTGTRPPAVVVCESIRAGEVRLALASGVVGIVLADSLASSFVACVASARAGQVSVPRAQARQIEPAALSTREKQILGLVVMGCPNGEIAERLVVAESTVKSHLSSAFGKLGVRSRNEAIDLIFDSERGLGMGILGLESEPIAN